MSFALGVLAALAAAVLYASGVTLQAIEAAQAPDDESLRPSLLRRLVTRRRWVIGTLCVAGGWAMQAVGLLLAPITIVQPALAVSVVVLLFIGARLFGEQVMRREMLAACAIVLGVGGLVLASPGQSDSHAAPLTLAIGMTALAAVALAPFALRGHRRFGSLVVFGAGLAYAWTGFSTKFLADGVSTGAYVVAGVWLAATALAAGVGLLSEMTALQSRSAIRVFPVVLVVQIVVAVLLAPLLAGESWSPNPLVVVVLAVSLVVVAVATRALAGARAVGRAVAPDEAQSGPAPTAETEAETEAGERRDGDGADHQRRERQAQDERRFGRDTDRGGGGGDDAGRRRREADEPLAVVHDGEAR